MGDSFKVNPRLNPSLIYGGCDAVIYELSIPEDAVAEISIPSFSRPWIHDGKQGTLYNFSPELLWLSFADLSKPIQAQVELVVTHNGAIRHERKDITLLPLHAWNMQRKHAPAMAALVLENSQIVMRLVKMAGCTPDPVYPRPPFVLAQTLYDTFQRAFNLYYLYEKELFDEPYEQAIRFPAQILYDGGGTCIDLALFYAASLWLGGCSPVIILLGQQTGKRHAIIGVWLAPGGYRSVVLSAAELAYAIKLNQLCVIDPNWLSRPASNFASAQQAALERIQHMGLLWGVDIEAARHYSQQRVPSLPSLVKPGEEDELILDDLPRRFKNEYTTERASQADQLLSRYAIEVISSQQDLYTGMRLPLVTKMQGEHIHGSFQIGRGPANLMNFYKNQSVSRNHAALIVSDNTIYLQDLGSKSGTCLAGRPLQPFLPERLSVGDVFSLGSGNTEQLQLIERSSAQT